MKLYEIVVRCKAQPLKHAKVLRITGKDEEYAKTLAGLLDGTSHLYVYKPGPDSPIGKCGVCGSALGCDVREVTVPDTAVGD